MKRVSADELKAIVARARDGSLSEEDCARLEEAIDTLEFVVGELDDKTVTLARLRSMFGLATSEKTRAVVGEAGKPTQQESAGGAVPEAAASESGPVPAVAREPVPGHGRNGVEDYPGAEKIVIPHESLESGDPCPECEKRKVYEQSSRAAREAAILVGPPARFRGALSSHPDHRCKSSTHASRRFSAPGD